jgi:Na+/proline symporter
VTGLAAAILLYLLLQFGIGVWASRRVRSEGDYLLAGRSLGYTLATFSSFATWFGAETVVGSAGNAYRDGVSFGSAEPFGYGMCLILMGLIFAVPLWRLKLTTLADLFRQRYSVRVERLAALILIPGSILWAAAQVRAFGQVLTTATTAVSLDLAIGIATGFVLLYAVFGGLLADAVTDVVQGVMLTGGLVVVLVAVIVALPAEAGVVAAVTAPGAVSLLPVTAMSWIELAEEWAVPIGGSVIATELVGRVIATRTATIARRSSILAGLMYVAIGTIPLVIGLIGRSVVPGLEDAEQVVPLVARQLLPTVLYALFAGAVISAILSTVDSTLLVSSGLLAHNLLVPVLKVEDERKKVLIARSGVVAFGGLAYLLALRAEGTFELVEQASAFGSSGVLVVVSFALFSRLGGARTAAATLLTGLAVYLVGAYSGIAAPFVASLLAALAVYVLGAIAERRTGRRAAVPAR